jgi:hypothetical protein
MAQALYLCGSFFIGFATNSRRDLFMAKLRKDFKFAQVQIPIRVDVLDEIEQYVLSTGSLSGRSP